MSKKTGEQDDAKKWGNINMHPFTYPNRWIDHATMLADAASSYEAEGQNAAVIQLITGIAAMDNEDDRHSIAYFVVEEIFKKTPTSLRALDEFVQRHKDKHIKGNV